MQKPEKLEDAKGVIRRSNQKPQNKGVIRSCKAKKDRQYNGQKKMDNRTNNDRKNITQQSKDQAI